MKSFFVLFEPEKRSRFRPQNVQGLNLGFGHERGLAADLVTIDSNEMFGNEAIHQGVDTLATWCPKGPQKMPILYFSLVLGTIALGTSAWSDCFWIIRTYKKKVLWWVKIDDFSTTAIAHSMYNINGQQKWPKKNGKFSWSEISESVDIRLLLCRQYTYATSKI